MAERRRGYLSRLVAPPSDRSAAHAPRRIAWAAAIPEPAVDQAAPIVPGAPARPASAAPAPQLRNRPATAPVAVVAGPPMEEIRVPTPPAVVVERVRAGQPAPVPPHRTMPPPVATSPQGMVRPAADMPPIEGVLPAPIRPAPVPVPAPITVLERLAERFVHVPAAVAVPAAERQSLVPVRAAAPTPAPVAPRRAAVAAAAAPSVHIGAIEVRIAAPVPPPVPVPASPAAPAPSPARRPAGALSRPAPLFGLAQG